MTSNAQMAIAWAELVLAAIARAATAAETVGDMEDAATAPVTSLAAAAACAEYSAAISESRDPGICIGPMTAERSKLRAMVSLGPPPGTMRCISSILRPGERTRGL